MGGFSELQIEKARDINDGTQHATLMNVVGASGNGRCGNISYSTIQNSPNWVNSGFVDESANMNGGQGFWTSYVNIETGERAGAFVPNPGGYIPGNTQFRIQ